MRGRLDAVQLEDLRKVLKRRLFETAQEVCEVVGEQFKIEYKAQGMCHPMHRNGFVCKKTKQTPMKVDEAAQAEFIGRFEQLQAA